MVKVTMDGKTFDFAIADELLRLEDPNNAQAKAERDNLVRRELAKWNPAAASALLEWGTTDAGEVLITVRRQAGTKGIMSMATPPRNRALEALLTAPQEVPPALVLALTLKALQISGQLTPQIVLAYQARIEAALLHARDESSYGPRVLHHLVAAQSVPSPWTPYGF